MERHAAPLFSEELMAQYDGKSAIFQDALNTGLNLKQVEEFSTWAQEAGMSPVTVADLRELRSHDTYGRLAGLVLNAAMGRLIHQNES